MHANDDLDMLWVKAIRDIKMERNRPKRHRFSPKMLLKNFSNATEQVWVNDGTNTFLTHITNVFKVHDLYAKLDWSRIPEGAVDENLLASVPKTYEFEDRLAHIESEAEPVATAIIEQARCQSSLALDQRQRDTLKRFVFALARRTPEAQNRTAIFSGYADAFYEVAKANAELNNYRLPNKESLCENPMIRQLRDKVLSNTRARFAAGDHISLEEEDLRFARETSIAAAVIRDKCNELVPGSHGITIIEQSLSQYLQVMSWLPVAPDVAIGITRWAGQEVSIELCAHNGGAEIVSSMNRSAAGLSQRIVGASAASVRSLK